MSKRVNADELGWDYLYIFSVAVPSLMLVPAHHKTRDSDTQHIYIYIYILSQGPLTDTVVYTRLAKIATVDFTLTFVALRLIWIMGKRRRG